MANRIDDLRKRLETQPQSRLFAQLAEELRKAGELDEAISVCRSGLEKNPNYPSARMTLGRALMEQGDLAGARAEFENVVSGAPDNILASRLLGECLEELGDAGAALERYKRTLTLAPGDEQLTERIAALEAGGQPPAGPTPPPPAAPEAPGAAAAPQAAGEDEPAPLALVEADESFELESPYESPTTVVGGEGTSPPASIGGGEAASPTGGVGAEDPAATPAASTAAEDVAGPAGEAGTGSTLPFKTMPEAAPAEESDAASPPPLPLVAADEDFEIERPHESPPTVMAGEGEDAATLPRSPADGPGDSAAAAATAEAPESPKEELATVTLGELYLRQGHPERALETYRRVLEREPGNARARARVEELEGAEAGESAPGPAVAEAEASPAEDGASRRAAIERTIGRLEAFLAAVRKGA